jgi:transcriptional regulator with XRE-family HTH domain
MRTGAAPPFGLLLRRHRAAAGLTQQELAERAHLSADAVSALERGVNRRPHQDTLALLAAALALAGAERAAFELAARRSDSPGLPVQPRGGGAPCTNLPLAMTSFIGREREQADARHLLRETRLLTLTGPGGCGKTRLALAVAAGMVDASPDGVWLVELAAPR